MNNTLNAHTVGTRSESGTRDNFCQELHREIMRLRRFSNRGLWALSLFLLVCIAAWNDFSFFPLPEAFAASLGKPPSAQAVSIMLLIYTFSAIILTLSRMTAGIEHRSSFCHVGYLTVFFLFYHFAKALDDNYWAVFSAGITILGVESYRIWSFCREVIARKTEQLEYVERTGQIPTEE